MNFSYLIHYILMPILLLMLKNGVFTSNFYYLNGLEMFVVNNKTTEQSPTTTSKLLTFYSCAFFDFLLRWILHF